MIISADKVRKDGLVAWLPLSASDAHLDIGSSQGDFLCRVARECPSTHFIGVEIVREKCESATRRILRNRIANVSIVNMEAHEFVSEHVPDEYIEAVHIYFPSPYPCRDLGLVRRLVTQQFLHHVYRIMKVGGTLRVVTDHWGYFKQINQEVQQDNRWWPVEWTAPSRTIANGYLVQTYWEEKFFGIKQMFSLQLLK